MEKLHEIEGLNNRELALAIWLGLLLFVVLISPKWRKHLQGLMKIFFSGKIFLSYLLSVLYTCIGVDILQRLGWWSASELKDTILWCTVTIVKTLYKINDVKKEKDFFKKALLENLKFTLIVEFVAETYTFSLSTELILLLVLVFIALMQAGASISPAYRWAASFFKTLAVLFGLLLLGHALYELITDYKSLINEEKLHEFVLSPLLFLWFIPWMYGLGILMRFESAFISVERDIKDKRLYVAAKRRAMAAFLFDADGLERWRKYVISHQPANISDLKHGIALIRSLKRIESNPPKVDCSKGWSPYTAKDFLLAKGIATGFYDNAYDEEWFAASSNIKLREEYNDNHLMYAVCGDRQTARELQLSLTVNKTVFENSDLATMLELCSYLCLKATLNPLPKNLINKITIKQSMSLEVGPYQLTLKRDDYMNHTGQYSYTFTILFISHFNQSG